MCTLHKMKISRKIAVFFAAWLALSGAVLPIRAAKQEIEDNLKQFAQNALSFNHIFPQEKVWVQLDNTGYFQGETIWFKAYVVQASTLHRAESQVLYVELLSPSGVVLEQKKMKVIYGQCDGSFTLTDKSVYQARQMRGMLNYPSGFYEIRAYTLNMLNFDDRCVFSRTVPVYEKPETDGDYYSKSPTIKTRRSDIEQYRPEIVPEDNVNISFYPEGGNLILGLESTVAFKATDKSGCNIDVELYPYADKPDFVSTLHDGMGSFRVTVTDRNQKVKVRYKNKDYTFKLPQAQNEGVAMSVEQKGNTVYLNARQKGANITDTVGLALTLRGEVALFERILANQDGEMEHAIAMNSLPTGVYNMVLFTKEGKVLASRMLFHKSSTPLPVLSYSLGQDRIEPFGKIRIDFNLDDGAGAPFADRFCISIRDCHELGTVYSDNICTNMLLTSDLKGYIHNPSYYFQSNDEEHSKALDLLMLVQGWQRYEWSVMSGVTPFKEKHRIETCLTLSGWILDKNGKKEMSQARVSSAIVPKDKSFVDRFYLTTEQGGYFGFDVRDFFGDADVTLQVDKSDKKNKLANARIMLERSMQPRLRAFEPQEMQFPTIEMIADRYAKKNQEKPQDIVDESLPTILPAEGFLLDQVDIIGARQFIDFNTFKALDVIKDAEAEYDKGEYASDIYGYLLGKGFPLYEKTQEEMIQDSARNATAGSEGQDESSTSQGGELINDINSSRWFLGAYRVFWYIHNSTRAVSTLSGLYDNPGFMDMEYIRSILVYDKPVSAGQVLTLTPLLQGGGRDASESYQSILSNLENSAYSNYIIVDVQLKDEHEIKTKQEIHTLSKRITTMHGYSLLTEFYSPEYPTGPIIGDVDYRRTLYWNPNVVTNKEGKASIEFYNNSSSKNFIIDGCGMTATGLPYSLDSSF